MNIREVLKHELIIWPIHAFYSVLPQDVVMKLKDEMAKVQSELAHIYYLYLRHSPDPKMYVAVYVVLHRYLDVALILLFVSTTLCRTMREGRNPDSMTGRQ